MTIFLIAYERETTIALITIGQVKSIKVYLALYGRLRTQVENCVSRKCYTQYTISKENINDESG